MTEQLEMFRPSQTLEDVKREYVERVLAAYPTLAEAARVLDINPATLYRLKKRWGLK